MFAHFSIIFLSLCSFLCENIYENGKIIDSIIIKYLTIILDERKTTFCWTFKLLHTKFSNLMNSFYRHQILKFSITNYKIKKSPFLPLKESFFSEKLIFPFKAMLSIECFEKNSIQSEIFLFWNFPAKAFPSFSNFLVVEGKRSRWKRKIEEKVLVKTEWDKTITKDRFH